jgi:hypothetical protein
LAERTTDKWERESLLRIAADWERLGRLSQQDAKPAAPIFKTGH